MLRHQRRGRQQRILGILLALLILLAVYRIVPASTASVWHDVGAVDTVADGPQLVEIAPHSIYIVRAGQQIIGLNRRDSHLKGCLVHWRPERKEFSDPCLGTRYRSDGTYIAGPAPRDLDRVALRIVDGRVLINVEQPIRGVVRNAGSTFWERIQHWYTSLTQ